MFVGRGMLVPCPQCTIALVPTPPASLAPIPRLVRHSPSARALLHDPLSAPLGCGSPDPNPRPRGERTGEVKRAARVVGKRTRRSQFSTISTLELVVHAKSERASM